MIEAYRARCRAARNTAFQKCVEELSPKLGAVFALGECGERALVAVAEQWKNRRPETEWDWREILRRHHDPDRMAMAIWSGERLSCLALGLTTSEAVELRFLEGDPRTDCPLIRKRALIALDASARYAQLLGRAELRVSPINSKIEALCEGLKFESRTSDNGSQLWVRRV